METNETTAVLERMLATKTNNLGFLPTKTPPSVRKESEDQIEALTAAIAAMKMLDAAKEALEYYADPYADDKRCGESSRRHSGGKTAMSKDRDTVIAEATEWLKECVNYDYYEDRVEPMADFALEHSKRVAAEKVREALVKVRKVFKCQYDDSPYESMEEAVDAVLAEMDGKE
jgi:Tfp pilus assembly protein PilE